MPQNPGKNEYAYGNPSHQRRVRAVAHNTEGSMAKTTANKWTQADWKDYVHVGPDTLAGQYMRRFWHPILRSDDLPPGRAKPILIMGEDLTLYRGEDGTPHCLAFRCAHRGTQLSTGWVEGSDLRCFY